MSVEVTFDLEDRRAGELMATGLRAAWVASALAMAVATGPRAAWGGVLWTVQAVQGNGAITCDAFAQGAMGRPPYEFRFRRSAKALLLIVSYDGPALQGASRAALALDGAALGEFSVTQTKFGARDALVISLDPRTVDFHEFERHRSFTVSTAGTSFGMAPFERDRIADNIDQCVKQFLTAPTK